MPKSIVPRSLCKIFTSLAGNRLPDWGVNSQLAGSLQNANFDNMKSRFYQPGILSAITGLALTLFVPFTLNAQYVQLIKLDKLEKRIESGRDTTFIINFWATWCVPCLEELPYFEQLAVEQKDTKLKVLLISMDFRSKLENTVVPFVRRTKLRNEVYLLDEKNQQDYIARIDSSWSGALPATLMIKKSQRRFFEKQFTYTELLVEYNKIQKP